MPRIKIQLPQGGEAEEVEVVLEAVTQIGAEARLHGDHHLEGHLLDHNVVHLAGQLNLLHEKVPGLNSVFLFFLIGSFLSLKSFSWTPKMGHV